MGDIIDYNPEDDKNVLMLLMTPFLEKEGLPTDEEFVQRLLNEAHSATKEIVRMRKDWALNKLNNRDYK